MINDLHKNKKSFYTKFIPTHLEFSHDCKYIIVGGVKYFDIFIYESISLKRISKL
jgi:hypothetical protein